MKGFIMDFEQNNNLPRGDSSGQSLPTQPDVTGPSEPIKPAVKVPKGTSGWKIFWGIVLALSIMANIALFLMLIGLFVVFTSGQRGAFEEEVIREGPRTAKIVVITLEGVIHSEQAEDVYDQLKMARQSKRVKGLILRVNSPGGTISGSDEIYNEIRKYRKEEGKPVIAFMQGLAASGGYYTSVACEKIIAEPTTITGSIGVMFGHFVIKELLEQKLGIQPVIITSGPKKDWPSSFEPITEEQRQYIQDKLIKPAYNRFVEVVADGRQSLTLADVNTLADGSIYGAEEALNLKLIDEIGYLDEAIELVKSLAKIEKAQVIEYRRALTLASFLGYHNRNILSIDRDKLYELSTPQILYLWSVY